MKFNLFDESTWRPSVVVDAEKAIANKAMGAIGQTVSELRFLKQKLQEDLQLSDDDDYVIARQLKNENPEAFALMQVEIQHSDGQVAEIIKDIDFILDSWADKEGRESNWKNLLPALKRLQPYLNTRNNYLHHPHNINEVRQITVKGNAAWTVFLATRKREEMWRANHKQRMLSSITNAREEERED